MATFRTSRPVSAVDPSRPHVILVGLPGAGKSAVGALLAGLLGRSFLDFDLEISRRAGMSVADIFGQFGEQHFRGLEGALSRELQSMGNMVLAPGGGWITTPETVALLHPPAHMVYLRVTPATAVRRMGAETASRPLLRHRDPEAEVARLLEARRTAYESADLVVDVERVTAQEVAEHIQASLPVA